VVHNKRATITLAVAVTKSDAEPKWLGKRRYGYSPLRNGRAEPLYVVLHAPTERWKIVLNLYRLAPYEGITRDERL
jgi:hypothetical protein